jgi:hypothetical protein
MKKKLKAKRNNNFVFVCYLIEKKTISVLYELRSTYYANS